MLEYPRISHYELKSLARAFSLSDNTENRDNMTSADNQQERPPREESSETTRQTLAIVKI